MRESTLRKFLEKHNIIKNIIKCEKCGSWFRRMTTETTCIACNRIVPVKIPLQKRKRMQWITFKKEKLGE